MAFNRHMLTFGREARRMTQAELAKQAGISQGKISKIEQGFLDPADGDLQAFSRVLDIPVQFFSEDQQPVGFPPYHFKRRKKIPAKTLDYIRATINIVRLRVGKLVASVDLEPSKKIPIYDVDRFNDVEQIAQIIREYWELPKGPVLNVVQAIEGAGGIIIQCDFGTKHLDALTQRVGSFPPMFFVNKDMAVDRLRFTLAHELAHLVLHAVPGDDESMEREADDFAFAFLMPKEDIQPHLYNLTIERLTRLKAYWKVSMQALLMRARKLGLVTAQQADRLWRQMSRAGYRLKEPVDLPIEEPHTLKLLLDIHLKRFGYSVAALADLLRMRFGEFAVEYLGQKPGPTIAKIAAA